MNAIKTLSREEMRNVKAGVGQCLYCSTPGGNEAWYRNDTSQDAGKACAGIYPAYEGNIDGARYAECGSHPDTMDVDIHMN